MATDVKNEEQGFSDISIFYKKAEKILKAVTKGAYGGESFFGPKDSKNKNQFSLSIANDPNLADYSYYEDQRFNADQVRALGFPVIAIDGGGRDSMSTFKGHHVPSRALGSDGKVYIFDNVFFIGSGGVARKLETVTKMDPIHKDDLEGVTPTIDFIPEIDLEETKGQVFGDNLVRRYTDLDPGDIEKIGFFLDQIEKGEYQTLKELYPYFLS